MTDISTQQWFWAAIASVFIGMSKTGIAGLGMMSVAMYAVIFPTRASVGIVLPLLITGDAFAIASYRSHAQWSHLWKLFPWAGIGIVSGYLVMHRIDNRQTQILIGILLLVMVVLHILRKWKGVTPEGNGAKWYAAFVGILAGFSTMTANAAGPLMVLYLLMMGLPKLQFMGTSAWFFFVINLVKVPFAADLGLFTVDSLRLNACLAVFVVVGALVGRWLLHHINQNMFEKITLVLTVFGALKMLLPS